MKQELWEDILDFEDFYEASGQGRIRNTKTGRIIKQGMNKYGYPQVCVSKYGKHYTITVAKCVWTAFNGKVPEGMQINHINEDKTDNRLENLNLMTPKENNNWGTHNERMKKSLSRTVQQYSRDGKLLKTYKSLRTAAEETGYSRGYLSDCCKGKFKICHGSVWKYAQTGQTQ